MQANLILYENFLVDDSTEFIDILLFGNKKLRLTLKKAIKLKLLTKKFIFRLYKKVVRYLVVSQVIHSYIIATYLIVKEVILNLFPTQLMGFFSFTGIMLFMYHYLQLYRSLFGLKMLFEWFPSKNWDRSSPVKRFLRRSTREWTRPFEKYFPSFFAWLIAYSLLPIVIETFGLSFLLYDLKNFTAGYKFEDLVTHIYLYTK